MIPDVGTWPRCEPARHAHVRHQLRPLLLRGDRPHGVQDERPPGCGSGLQGDAC